MVVRGEGDVIIAGTTPGSYALRPKRTLSDKNNIELASTDAGLRLAAIAQTRPALVYHWVLRTSSSS